MTKVMVRLMSPEVQRYLRCGPISGTDLVDLEDMYPAGSSGLFRSGFMDTVGDRRSREQVELAGRIRATLVLLRMDMPPGKYVRTAPPLATSAKDLP